MRDTVIHKLIDLGKKLKNPIGKSGVNYRLKKIIQIAEEI